ncbi:MAG TPA: helix-turn-helix domain-containing protein [Chthoniobacterales bacterium]|nr:helix-turn-helix domain-containing protein [Chthoniobacterales bacterium]
MEGLGKKLQEARLARNLTLDEAGRMTKIRPGRLQEIENEDFSEFASLAYAKGFLLIYGKFLDVDVTPYLEAFETSESVTVDGYSYLQDNPAPKPSRQVVVRPHRSSGRGSFLPFVIGVVVLVVGFMVMKWVLELQRLKPDPRPTTGASPVPTVGAEKIIAPQALPVENVASPTPAVVITPPPPQPSVPIPSPALQPIPSEPEVRRAEPVNPQDLPKVRPSVTPVRRQVRPPPPRPPVAPGPALSPARPTPRRLLSR